MSFFLMFVIMAVATDTRAVGEAAAIAIGGTIALDALFGGPISGASMNPMRSLAPALVSGDLHALWLYIVAPVAARRSARSRTGSCEVKLRSRVIALALAVLALVPLPGIRTPTGNISCFYVPGGSSLLCDIKQADYLKRVQSQCTARSGLDWHGFTLNATKKGDIVCSGGILYNSNKNYPKYTTLPVRQDLEVQLLHVHVALHRAHVRVAHRPRALHLARQLARLVATPP
jgi:Glycerol uptake facilitator and related permeases (Major Intrinsic Protein Family)